MQNLPHLTHRKFDTITKIRTMSEISQPNKTKVKSRFTYHSKGINKMT